MAITLLPVAFYINGFQTIALFQMDFKKNLILQRKYVLYMLLSYVSISLTAL